MKTYYVYMLAIKKNGTLYTGVTNNLIKRVAKHKRKEVKGFTQRYSVDELVWYEQTNDIRIAIEREKQLKRWNRKWKIRLIEKNNPEWKSATADCFLKLVEVRKYLNQDLFYKY